MLYFDHNATAPLLPEAAEALSSAYAAGFANPASQHAAGRRARRALEDARERLAELLGADVHSRRPDRLIFTSGGTEANNLVLNAERGARSAEVQITADSSDSDSSAHRAPRSALLLSSIEHPSLREAALRRRVRGDAVEFIPVDGQGRIDPDDAARRLRPTTQIVSIMLGNNETGVVQPVAEAAARCRRADTIVHTDAVQAVGKIAVNFRELGVDALTAAAHKFGGPIGIGLLLVRADVALDPLLVGGHQQGGFRPGTESVPLVLAMLAALEASVRDDFAAGRRTAERRDQFETELRAALPEAIVHSAGVARLPQTSCVALPGLDRQALLLALDQAGLCCSTGSACASGSSEPSPTLVAMGCDPALLQSSLRFSFGPSTTAAQVSDGVERIRRVCHDLRRGVERRKMPSAGR